MTRIRLSLRLHRTLGLWVGGAAMLIVLSGSLLVFRPELSRVLYPAVFASRTCESSVALVALGELASRAAAAHPDMELVYVEDMQTPCTNAFAVALRRDASGPRELRLLGMDPSSGEPAGSMPLSDSVLNFALMLHTTLLAGERNRWIVGVVGAGLVMVVLTGLFAWLAGQARRLVGHLRRTLRIRRSFLTYDSHRAGGLLLSLPLGIVALTGISMALERQLQPVATFVSGASAAPTPERLIERNGATPGPLGIARAITLAERLLADSRPASAGFAGENGELVYVRGRVPGDDFLYGRSVIYFDRRTARPLSVVDSRSAPSSWFLFREAAWTLHTGVALGTKGRIAVICTGIGAAVLFILGTSMWWRRTQRRPRRRAVEP